MSSNVDLHLSALIDGELDAAEYDKIIKQLKADTTLKDKWTRYHLIGDAMKVNLPSVVDHGLCGRIQKALEIEPTLLAPASQVQAKREKPDSPPEVEKQTAIVVTPAPFRSKGYAIAASVLLVSTLGFMLMSESFNQNLIPLPAMTATAPQTAPVAAMSSEVVPVVNSSPAEAPSLATQLVKAPADGEPKDVQMVQQSGVPPRIFLDQTLAQDDRWDRLDPIRVIPQLDSHLVGRGEFSSTGPSVFPFAQVVNFGDSKTE